MTTLVQPAEGSAAGTPGGGAPLVPVRWWQPHNPAFWVYWAFVAGGAWSFYGVISGFRIYPSAVVASAVLLTLYALPFIWFINHRDRFVRQPASLIVLAFAWGGLAATWVIAVPGNAALLSLYSKGFGVHFAETWGPPLTAPIIEESAKFIGVVLIVLLARTHVRSTFDGLVLGAFTGLGFQILEDASYLLNQVAANFGSQPIPDVVQVFVTRALTGFWSHALYTAITGAGLGYFLTARQSRARRVGVAIGLYLVAMIAHGLLDAALALGLIAVPLSAIVSLTAIVLVVRLADREERGWIRAALGPDVATGVIAPPELDVITGPRRARRRYLREVRQRQGRPAGRNAKHLLAAELDLAVDIATTGDSTSPDATRSRSEVIRIRESFIRATGNSSADGEPAAR